MACGKYFRSYLVGSFSALGGFLFGYHTGVISGVLTMKDFLHMINIADKSDSAADILNTQIGLIVGILLFGCFLGSLIGGQTSDRFSRKYSISFFSFIFTISAGMQVIRGGLTLLLIARFVAGKKIINYFFSLKN
jgi:MFS family permease